MTKIEQLDAALQAAIEERTGRDWGEVSVYDLAQWKPIDFNRALEILGKDIGEFWNE